VTTVVETIKFVVFSCRGWMTIGCLLTMGDEARRVGGKMLSFYNR
jgi:hypothetical protein